MPPKQRITREMILEKSFEMFCREGMDVVNARSVAKALNCSTQPIFSYFSGMDDLKNALDEKARVLFEQRIEAGLREEEALVSAGCAYVRFAAEQPHLFTHLTARANPLELFAGKEQREALIDREAAHTGLAREQAETLCRRMFMYIHGAAAICACDSAAFSIEELEQMIRDAHGMNVAFFSGR